MSDLSPMSHYINSYGSKKQQLKHIRVRRQIFKTFPQMNMNIAGWLFGSPNNILQLNVEVLM